MIYSISRMNALRIYFLISILTYLALVIDTQNRNASIGYDNPTEIGTYNFSQRYCLDLLGSHYPDFVSIDG
jgi:hypothetical protein